MATSGDKNGNGRQVTWQWLAASLLGLSLAVATTSGGYYINANAKALQIIQAQIDRLTDKLDAHERLLAHPVAQQRWAEMDARLSQLVLLVDRTILVQQTMQEGMIKRDAKLDNLVESLAKTSAKARE